MKNKSFDFVAKFSKKVQKKSEISIVSENRHLNTFLGVFTPTVLNILGVMIFLRQGWVVGNAGLLGALLLIVFSCLITGISALSLSTIASNIRLGAGGVFSLVSQSLGLQIGGSIGIPLYLAQTFSVVLYIFGFVEIWISFFPEHHRWMVVWSVFLATFLISYIGAKFAFKIQIIIMVGVALALVSIFLGMSTHEIQNNKLSLWGKFKDGNFWYLFAVYFPAVTGIKTGASLSGNLINPRKSIPLGTMLAWGVGTFIYILLTFWYAFMGSEIELRSQNTFSIDRSFFPAITMVGILFSCFVAGLTSMIAAPRVLQSLGIHGIVPGSKWVCQIKNHEPRQAILLTGLIVLVTLLFFRDLNQVAVFITQFFLIIYFILNTILSIEQHLNLVSFRPKLKIPKFIPIIGSFLCLLVMFLISPVVGFLSIFFICVIFVLLNNKTLKTPWETVESGIFYNFAQWSAKKLFLTGLGDKPVNRRLWKPDLLVVYQSDYQLEQTHDLVKYIIYPQGSVRYIYFKKLSQNISAKLRKRVSSVKRDLKKMNLLCSFSVVEHLHFHNGLKTTLAVLQNCFFHPNSLLVVLYQQSNQDLKKKSDLALEYQMAFVVLVQPEKNKKIDKGKDIVLWVRDQSPNWQLGLELSNLDYSILLAYKIRQNWNGNLKFVCVTRNKRHKEMAKIYLQELVNLARMENEVSLEIIVGDFKEQIRNRRADLHIFGLSNFIYKNELIKIAERCSSTCLFVRDSGAGIESALV